MKIRYQNGTALEGITLSRTAQTMRVAIKGADDAMELTNIHGTWVSDDCEPVTMETGMIGKQVENYTEDYFICSQELAGHLVHLLFTGGADDLLEEPRPVKTSYAGASPMIA